MPLFPDLTQLASSLTTAPLRLALEMRAGLEAAAMLAAQPLLRSAPRGDGHPVLVFPRLLGSDLATLPLRAYLTSLGYAAAAWNQGLNFGPHHGVMPAARESLGILRARHGQKVSLIGWSVGGLYARELAKQVPNDVRQVITLGTPLTGRPKPADLWRWVEQATGQPFGLPETHGPLEAPPPVPTTAIYSRSDGIVPWQDSVQLTGPQWENIEVNSSHLGLGVHPLVFYAIADRLAQPEGHWRAFRRDGLKAAFYPDPQRLGWF